MPHITTDDGVKLYYQEVGTGIPIVFVHESAGDCRSWEAQFRHFGRSYRCIAYNARGFPPSDVPEGVERYSQARARDDTRAVLDGLNIGKAHIVGLSMGGFAALHFGFTYPDRARSLTIGRCGALRGNRHGESRRILRTRADPRAVPEQGSARLAGIRRSTCRAFRQGLRPDDARRTKPAAVSIR